jgi:hypothetical protein
MLASRRRQPATSATSAPQSAACPAILARTAGPAFYNDRYRHGTDEQGDAGQASFSTPACLGPRSAALLRGLLTPPPFLLDQRAG